MFASIPLVFAAQQATEGVVWLTIDGSAHATVHRLAVFAFLGLALVVWPIWLPLSLQLSSAVRSDGGRSCDSPGSASLWLPRRWCY